MHESTQHESNHFITLTYRPEALIHRPNPFTLVKKDHQDFVKRLRRRTGQKIRYYHCGEYGTKLSRPHYHTLFFGLHLNDLKLYSRGKHGDRLYTSELINDTWGHGYAPIGKVTMQSAAYCAGYCLKKLNGELAQGHYERINEQTGEVCEILPEYTSMSLKPGIGQKWFEKYQSDVYPDDFVTHKGKKIPTPKYYDKLLDRLDPDELQYIKERRLDKAKKHSDNTTRERLDARNEHARILQDKISREPSK